MKSSSGFFSFVLLLVLVFTTAVAGAYFATQTIFDRPISPKEVKLEPIYQPMDSDDEEDQTEIMTLHDKTTVLIMGVDEREDDVGRSDTMMVAMLDPDSNRVSLISIPRDTWVSADSSAGRIGSLYSWGGASLIVRHVSALLGISIHQYIVIDMSTFAELIDVLGGIDIYVDKRMKYEDPWDAVRGHDAVSVLTIGLREIFGSYNARALNDNSVSGALRLAYSPEDFRKSKLFLESAEYAESKGLALWKFTPAR